ncbi:MAG: DEAD/DEAH box helicase family protein [Epsilonproteobacteria bacterium]|nr:DEAD/DEAH box helicase family protein [Campylobacterota bacterium]OIO14041.1 MAG: restriction endonuclease subunit R [Helicobacteraceae bacterium CG1_02_36_14]PIP11463.1 MAG: restriction endonuclease subunit R [Sulfurimonas sp. CG23_combo_of_CG06-09_8_20_14_all_36_33]PIS25176.1 MAG: restriction endonuclease subunit R [Sulfurimonas sp. CG08_land_8_20_14_0_20_36_33]PIU36193.1 MAG: restriction endonuclease subunit R [Sulfurimonas sp. CG07_land_8_20_14_0_80_36_56]PIV04724.1 MAG: restriction end
MNESETRAELIDPKLLACGWGVVPDSKVLRERDVCRITDGRIQVGGGRAKPLIADYILVYKGVKLAVIEAKSDELEVSEGVAQAKLYAQKLQLETTYSTNGKEIYSICLKSGREELVENFLTPVELWEKTYSDQNEWRDRFSSVPYESKSGTWQPRYYQEIAVKNTLEAVAKNQNRILLTLATGTGKTAIAFQIAWKLFHTRWNLKRDGQRRPRILFLADRNILADQAFNSFSAFPEDALVRIKPKEIKKSKKVPTNGSIFFTIFQSFMRGTDESGESEPYFGAYPPDYFDFIIIDECHRGGANDEGNWRAILEYFSPAVQLGLTATPKRKDNVDTYAYFGEPVYVYSLKEGINDGFLTPFKVKRIKTTLDDYIFTSDDNIIEGEIEEGKLYKEEDFNKIIEIKAREEKRVRIFMNEANENEKTIIFCATQEHAALIRDIVNQNKKQSKDANYCVRVTANDGEIGEQFLREFQDNEKLIPTVLSTSQKLSTGVDARNIRNIVLLRPVKQMIEFKQIVGRGTRLFDGKEFFTIYDFVDAYQRFLDPEWDGEPIEAEPIEPKKPKEEKEPTEPKEPKEAREKKQKVKVKLKNGKELEIEHMMSTSFWSADGKPISADEFLQNLFGELPKFFTSEEELRTLWSHPLTRKTLLEKLDEAGFGKEELNTLKKLVNAEQSDLFDVLEYVFNGDVKPISREARVNDAKTTILALLNEKQKEFIEFVLSQYIETGVEELSQEKLPILLTNKYQSLEDAKEILGDVAGISSLFIEFQKYLYMQKAA